MMLPLARAEGIGLLSYLKLAKELGHQDDYAKQFELDREFRRRNVRYMIADGRVNQLHIASAYSYWLAAIWNRSSIPPSEVVGTSITSVDQELMVGALDYMLS